VALVLQHFEQLPGGVDRDADQIGHLRRADPAAVARPAHDQPGARRMREPSCEPRRELVPGAVGQPPRRVPHRPGDPDDDRPAGEGHPVELLEGIVDDHRDAPALRARERGLGGDLQADDVDQRRADQGRGVLADDPVGMLLVAVPWRASTG
jgi:hypothetical protein